MSQSLVWWILVISGVVTAGGGLAALFAPHMLLRLAFGVSSVEGALLFFVRHWGVLIFVIGALIVEGAYAPAIRPPVLAAAAIEKFAVVILVFFGPLKRTAAMTAIALMDGLFALLYIVALR
ncbi:MAG TPA: hypothetical protein VKG44_00795 [Candidatus Baltobacteraceae bacterium]|nr:hypothetical protein [Candidatus Baltobacteraceae bacterium]